jgi:hypothetical protein
MPSSLLSTDESRTELTTQIERHNTSPAIRHSAWGIKYYIGLNNTIATALVPGRLTNKEHCMTLSTQSRIAKTFWRLSDNILQYRSIRTGTSSLRVETYQRY